MITCGGLLRRHQWKKEAPRPRHPKNTWGPKRALKKTSTRRSEGSPAAVGFGQGQTPAAVFEDEGRSHRINNLPRCWSPPGGSVVVGREIIREFSYSFCSVCPETEQSYSMVLPQCNTGMMELYLKGLRRHFSRYRLVRCLDNAAWHVSEKLHWPMNLPPCTCGPTHLN